MVRGYPIGNSRLGGTVMGGDRNATYILTFQDRKEQNAKKSGAELMDKGMEVKGMSGNFSSEII